ncbi:hypothetical protein [Streptomyces sp. NPDC051704]|uniref:hypothetical protein n=1 Tax=Streptomyces sp. NPDC051704 TaxID=3365671 RepID=UPI0037AB8C75
MRRSRGTAGEDDARVLAVAARWGRGARIRRRAGRGQGAGGQGEYAVGGRQTQSSAM